MSSDRPEFARAYRSALEEYLARAREADLERAYELGRRAVAEGLGVLEMIELQNEVLASLLPPSPGSADSGDVIRAAGKFFLESLSPYEMTHRAFREANSALLRLNDGLEEQAKRIAHALHDDAGQLLVSVHLGVEEIARGLPPEHGRRLRQLREILDQIEERLRQFSHELRPTVLDDLGLLPALRFLAQRVSQRTGLTIDVESSVEERLPSKVETALYRIFQEALNNVAKHSRARQVRVDLREENDSLRYSIRDDGVGLDANASSRAGGRRGLGLMGIRERVDALRGTLQIRSTPGRGTELLITIPPEA